MDETSVGPDLAELTRGLHDQIPVMAAMGLELVELRRGYAAARIPLEPNRNHIGTVYAGSLFTVAEVLGGAVGLTSFDLPGFVPVVKSLEIRFLRRAGSAVRAHVSLTDDEIADIETTARADGKATFELEATVVDEAGEVVATTTGTYQVRRLG